MIISQRYLIAFCAVLCLSAPLTVQAAQTDIEDIIWELVSTTDDLNKIEAFIKSYPESAHIDEAQDIADRLRTRQASLGLEETIFDTIGNVTYNSPLAFGDEHLIGQSLADITASSPAYPPIAGLPEELWKNQSCKSCHNWTRADLCVQANNYVAMDPKKYREKMHPFGGLLKINLRNWAQNDCQ